MNNVNNKLPKLTEEEFLMLEKFRYSGRVFLTGSNILGGENSESDIDYVIMKDDFEKIVNDFKKIEDRGRYLTEDHYLEAPDDFQSVKYRYGNSIINFIVVTNDVTYNGWKVATKVCCSEKEMLKDILKNKEKRVKFFEAIKLAYICLMDEKGPKLVPKLWR